MSLDKSNGEGLTETKETKKGWIYKTLGEEFFEATDDNGKKFVVRFSPGSQINEFIYTGYPYSGFDELYAIETDRGLEFVGRRDGAAYVRYRYDSKERALVVAREHREINMVDVFEDFVVMYEGKTIVFYTSNGDFVASSRQDILGKTALVSAEGAEIEVESAPEATVEAEVCDDESRYHLSITYGGKAYEAIVDATGHICTLMNRENPARKIGECPSGLKTDKPRSGN